MAVAAAPPATGTASPMGGRGPTVRDNVMGTAAVEGAGSRFALRPELSLLYDRAAGLEHRLNATALHLVRCALADDPDRELDVLASWMAVSRSAIRSEYERLWDGILSAPDQPQPLRKSGAPREWAAVDVPFPLVLELELTRVCNWHCDFCYNVWKVSDAEGRRSRSDSRNAPDAHLPLDTARRILDESRAGECLRVRFSGGEPTLHPAFGEIVSYAGQLGFDIELFTNGTRLSPAMAAHLRANNARVVLVSIHGLESEHNRLTQNRQAFRHAIDAVNAACAEGLHVVVEALVTHENIADIPELVEQVNGLGVEHLSFMPYVATGPADPRRSVPLTDVRSLIAVCRERVPDVSIRVPCAPRHCLTDRPTPIDARVDWEFDDHCAAGVLWASVAYDGRLRHCPHSNVYAGHVDEGIGTVWRDRIVPTVRSVLAQADPVCSSCSQFGPCQGGCHLGRVTSYGGAPVAVALLPARTRKAR